MDNEGKIKELNTHFDDYATQFLTARSTYYVLKVESKIIINYLKQFYIFKFS
jgi:Putative Interleukin 2 receptor, gamma chain